MHCLDIHTHMFEYRVILCHISFGVMLARCRVGLCWNVAGRHVPARNGQKHNKQATKKLTGAVRMMFAILHLAAAIITLFLGTIYSFNGFLFKTVVIARSSGRRSPVVGSSVKPSRAVGGVAIGTPPFFELSPSFQCNCTMRVFG